MVREKTKDRLWDAATLLFNGLVCFVAFGGLVMPFVIGLAIYHHGLKGFLAMLGINF